MKKGFSLIEIIVVISIISIIFVFANLNFGSFGERASFSASLKSIVSNLRMCQQNAISKKETVEIVFKKTRYTFDSKSKELPKSIYIETPKMIRFSSSGNTPPGGSGTIILKSKNQSAKIIVSTIGRVRIE